MRILVVEDDHRIAASIKKGLEQEKMIVDVAHDGLSGYDLAESEDYDVVVLDLMLPGMTGLEICDKLRQNDVQTPILILTARGQTENKVEGLKDNYIRLLEPRSVGHFPTTFPLESMLEATSTGISSSNQLLPPLSAVLISLTSSSVIFCTTSFFLKPALNTGESAFIFNFITLNINLLQKSGRNP